MSSTPQKNPLLQAALAYASRLHWPVFPCKPRAKKPLTPHGFQDASLDEEQIRKWWKEWPQANIGVPTGVAFWVLDVDPRNGGQESLDALVARYGGLFDAIQQMSGGGGRHYLFLPDAHVRSGEGVLGDGIDIKSTGGYILVAPSIHPSGKAYAWDGLKSIIEEKILPAPSWLLVEIAAVQRNGGGSVPRVAPQKIAKGVQHATLVSHAGSMRRRGCEFGEIYALLSVMNRNRCTEPGTDKDIRDIAESVCEYPPDKLVPDEALPPEALRPAAPEPPEPVERADVSPGPRQNRRPVEGQQAARPAAPEPPGAVPEPPPPGDEDAPPHQRAARPAAKRPASPQILNCGELLQVTMPAEEMLFEDGYPLPARGLTLKVGAPKSGKTLLAVQEAIAIARNQPLFEFYRVLKPGPVMIIEQDDPGGAASVRTILERSGVKADTPLHFVSELPFGLGANLIDWLEKKIAELKLVFVVIDSYTSIRGSHGSGMDIVKQEQTELRLLDALGKRSGSGIELIHHASKGAAALDWTQTASGTFAMTGAVEGQIHISRFMELEGAAPERLVRMQGRHAEAAQVLLRFRSDTLDYEFVLRGGAAEFYPILKQIKSELGEKVFTPKELCQATGMSRSTAHRYITRLQYADALQKLGFGTYKLSPGLTL